MRVGFNPFGFRKMFFEVHFCVWRDTVPRSQCVWPTWVILDVLGANGFICFRELKDVGMMNNFDDSHMSFKFQQCWLFMLLAVSRLYLIFAFCMLRHCKYILQGYVVWVFWWHLGYWWVVMWQRHYMYYERIGHIIHYKERCQQGILSPISFIIYTPQGKIK
jgi:hypothetical protein